MDIFEEQAYPTPYSNSTLLPLLLISLAIQKHSPRTSTTFLEEYDYVIVGAGSAGSVVASRLSEDPRVNVLLLEAGKPPPILTEIPAIAKYFHDTDIDWQYSTTPQKYTAAGLVDRRVPWTSGKALGGSSILNDMQYVRGNRRSYNEWAEMGATGWSYEEVFPYFKKLEDNTDPEYLANGYHATGGPITASTPPYYPLKKLAVMEAIWNKGYSFVDPNGAKQNGFYDHQGAIRKGQRCSTAKGYLVPAEDRTNLDILPNAMVRKVIIKNGKAVGVKFDFQNRVRQVNVRREVILSAGTTNTAQLLMLSGIGPANELNKFKIPVVADLPVGQNFQDHPLSYLMYEVDDSIPRFDSEIRQNDSILQYINTRTGSLTCLDGFQVMSFLNSWGNGMKGDPDYTLYFGDYNLQSGLIPEITEALMAANNKSLITCASQLLQPRSVGSVTLQSTNPYDPPVIDPNYFADERDFEDVVKGLKVCNKIMNNPAVKRIGAKPLSILIPGCEKYAKDSDMYIRCIVRTIVVTANHQVGTAKMGNPSDPTTVVDPQLKVKGVEGLRVVDASVMPTTPWGNTNIPTIMIAEKASDIIKKDIGLSVPQFHYFYDSYY